jgi:hypothetical protein
MPSWVIAVCVIEGLIGVAGVVVLLWLLVSELSDV